MFDQRRECKMEEEIIGSETDKVALDNDGQRHGIHYRILKTIFMVFAPASMGLYLELAGPTLYDLRQRVNANYEEISRALMARSAGYFVGSLTSGFLADKYADHVELFLFIAFLMGSVGTALAPWMNSLALLGVLFNIQGIGQGFIDTNNNVLCLRLWGEKAAAPVHALHFGFGIGAMIAPQLARPFISSQDNRTENQTTERNFAPIEIPYSISAIISFIFSIVFLGFYIYDRFHETKTATKPTLQDVRRIFSPASCAGGKTAFGIQLFLLVFFYYFNIVGGERAYGKFLYSYAMESKLFDKNSATTLNSVFWACFTSGRGLAIIASKWVPPKYLLITELLINIISTVILAIWAFTVPAVLWSFTAILGLFLAPVFPTGLALLNLYVEMSGMAVALVFVGSASGGMFYQWLTGYLFQNKGPRSLMYVMVGYALFISFIYFLMCVLTFRVKQRFHGTNEENLNLNKRTNSELNTGTYKKIAV